MITTRFFCVSGILLSSLSASIAWGDTWYGLRGPAGTCVSTEKNLPTRWSLTKNLAWQIDLPGRGNSSPAVTKNRIYLTSQTEDTALWVIAIDRKDGRIIWKKRIGEGILVAYGPPNAYNHRHNAASPSVSADEEHVWAYFGTGHLVCLDTKGEIVWEHNMADEYGAYDMKFGMASSPRLWGDLLYVACMNKGPSYVVAFDKKTGDEVWITERKLPAAADGTDAYSSPVVFQWNGRTQLVVSGSDHVNAYELLTGKQIWISSGLKVQSEYGRIIASPSVGEGVIIACAAGGRQAIALRAGGQGDITTSHRLWTIPRMADCPTPTIHNGLVYAPRDNGTGRCYDLNMKTGDKPVWEKRLSGKTYRASPVVADGKVYMLSKAGICTVIKEGRKYRQLAENRSPGTFFCNAGNQRRRHLLAGTS